MNIAEAEMGSGWQTVIPGPTSFDLVELTGVEGVLGEVQLQPGRYNQLRLEVVEVLITVEGEEKSADIPSGKLRFVGGFNLVAGETTVLTLDFDAAKSVVLRGRMDPLLKPVVKLLVRMGGQSPADAVPVADALKVGETPAPLPAATTGPRAVAEAWAEAFNSGDLEALAAIYSDDVVFSFGPLPEGEEPTFHTVTGKGEVLANDREGIGTNTQITLSNMTEDGDTARSDFSATEDETKELGLALTGMIEVAVQGDKLKSVTATFERYSKVECPNLMGYLAWASAYVVDAVCPFP